jgi:hypothetical protein
MIFPWTRAGTYFLLLLLGAGGQDGHGLQRSLDVVGQSRGKVHAGELLGHQPQGHPVQVHSPVLVRNLDGEEPLLSHLGDEVVGKFFVPVQVPGDRRDFPLGKLLGHILKHLLFLG